jgi:hypothetical protein
MTKFKFNSSIISSSNVGIFPDLTIKISPKNDLFPGGELVELKDGKTYMISSFNSTIPTGMKNIQELFTKNSIVRQKMLKAGNNVESMPERQVYYLIRGKKDIEHQKIVLVHGSFFETIPVSKLISKAFSKIVVENIGDDSELNKIIKLFSRQEMFSKVRHVKGSAIKLRFRIMAEVSKEGNILDDKTYPEILENTINLVIPYDEKISKEQIIKKFNIVFGKDNSFKVFKLEHKISGRFVVFQYMF